jgi:nitrogen fixation protein FixH
MAQIRSKGWWYPLIFLGFFVIVFSVNATMAYFATSSFTGLSTQHAYEEGLAYNRNLAMAKAQAGMGWTVDTAVIPAGGTTPGAAIAITYRDRDGKPVDGLTVAALVSRPTIKGYDHEITLAPQGNGRYGTTIALPLPGEWDMDVMATGNDTAYQLQHRFILP